MSRLTAFWSCSTEPGDEPKGVNMKIENQAMMFALLSKYTIIAKGEDGRSVIREGMARYGRERGARMAARARANGDPVTLWTNQAYGEWQPDHPGQMTFGCERTEPTLVTFISKCEWCETWRRYDITEYGREYCVNVDAAVYEGFGCGAVCTPLGPAMSWGGDICRFDWGLPLTEEEVGLTAAKKAELGTSAMRGFDFHTAHLYHAVTEAVKAAFPEDAEAIISRAVEDYINIFGQEDYDRLKDFPPEEF